MTTCDRCSARAATQIKRSIDSETILSLCQHHTDKFGPELDKQGYTRVPYGHTPQELLKTNH